MDFTCGEGVSAANPRERRNTQPSHNTKQGISHNTKQGNIGNRTTFSGKSSRLCSSTRHFEQHSRENDFAFVFKIAKYVNNLGIRDRQSEEWWDVGVLCVWCVWNVDFSMVL